MPLATTDDTNNKPVRQRSHCEIRECTEYLIEINAQLEFSKQHFDFEFDKTQMFALNKTNRTKFKILC